MRKQIKEDINTQSYTRRLLPESTTVNKKNCLYDLICLSFPPNLNTLAYDSPTVTNDEGELCITSTILDRHKGTETTKNLIEKHRLDQSIDI